MKQKIRECPKCGSRNVEPDTTGKTVFSHGDITRWTCNECGYSGIFPVTEETEEKERDQQKNQNHKNNHSTPLLLALFVLSFLILILATIHLN